MRSYKQGLKKKITLGEYIVYCAILTYLYVLSAHGLTFFDLAFHETTYTTMIVLLIVDPILFILMLKLPYPLVLFGFNLHRWKKYTLETILYSILFCFVMTSVKWILIQTVSSIHNLPLIKIELVHMMGGFSLNYYKIILNMIIYFFIMIPLQIFVVHSAAQSPVLFFLRVKHRGLLSILIGALWFSVGHLSLPYGFALSMLIPGFFVSMLYCRQKSLLGTWIAHAIIGIWGLYFLDLARFLRHLTGQI